MPGVLLCCSAHQALKGAPWLGSYCVVRCVRRFDGPASVSSAANASMWDREAMVMAPPTTCDLAVMPCFHGCLAFLHWHFPPQSPSSHHFNPSLHSQEQMLPWDCSTIPKLQLPTTALQLPNPWKRGPVLLSGVCMAAARTV